MKRVLIVGVGRMGFAHAKACAALRNTEIIGLVARNFSKWNNVTTHFADVPLYNDYYAALKHTKPDVVIISSFTDTHTPYAVAAMQAGADVFVEKPLAMNKREAGFVIATARKLGRKLVVGYILRHHMLWQTFVECCKTIGKPITMTMMSNQYSVGNEWEVHKGILNAGLSPLVDAGIHYVDVMGQLMDSDLINIKAFGKKTSVDMMVANDTNMTLSYEDGSTLYFESGFGPTIDKNKVNVRKAVGPTGEVEISVDDIIRFNGIDARKVDDEYDKSIIDQQKYFFNAINNDIDLEDHWQNVAMSMAIVLIAEQEMKLSS